jgi:endo-1,4-beta-xylanase
MFSAATALSLLLLTFSLLAADQAPPALKDAFKGSFLIGAALNPAQFAERDARDAAIVKAQFDSISPEDVLKWERVHPEPGRYDFDLPDKYVAFGEKNHMFIVGHTLVWHQQTPKWVFEDAKGNPVDRETLLKRMREHILTVVGRYKGRINSWDVVNEALNDDGTLRQTPWLKIIGEEYIAKAFEFAHEADPKAEVQYNDYSLENEAKRNGAIELIRKLRAQGVPVTGVGLQGHYKIDWPSVDQVDATIAAFAKLGVKVMITELDVDVLPPAWQYHGADISANVELQPKLNPYTSGLPDSVQQTLAKRYSDLFGVFLKHRGVLSRVTLWGVTDASSWLNNWPVPGRTNYPLLFDRDGRPKPAFDAVIKAARGVSAAK